jgi:PPM family protein phosphatase
VIDQGELLFRLTNEAMREDGRVDLRLGDLATSLTMAYVADTDLFVAHVGHSKAFLYRAGKLMALTTDHTFEQLRLKAPALADVASSRIDLKHVVVETVGGRAGGPQIDIEHVELLNDDRILLCTNGLTDVVGETLIADVLTMRRRPKEDCQRLVDLALAAGGPDNVTTLLADYRVRSSRDSGRST